MSKGIAFNTFVRLYAEAIKSETTRARFLAEIMEIGDYNGRSGASAALYRFKKRIEKDYGKKVPALAESPDSELSIEDIAAMGLNLEPLAPATAAK